MNESRNTKMVFALVMVLGLLAITVTIFYKTIICKTEYGLYFHHVRGGTTDFCVNRDTSEIRLL